MTDAVRKNIEKSLPRYNNDVLYRTERDKAILGALVDKLRKVLGKDSVITKLTDAEKALIDFVNENLKLKKAKKRALKTASISDNQKHRRTVVSSADGAKIQKNIDLRKIYFCGVKIKCMLSL